MASSNELKREREMLAECTQLLNRWLSDRPENLRIELVKWEYLDSSMGVVRKQTEYNRELQKSDAVVALFWRKIGQYTEEEVEKALEELTARHRVRWVDLWFKEDGKEVSISLSLFRAGLSAEKWTGVKTESFSDFRGLKGLFMARVFEVLSTKGIVKPEAGEMKKYGLE